MADRTKTSRHRQDDDKSEGYRRLWLIEPRLTPSLKPMSLVATTKTKAEREKMQLIRRMDNKTDRTQHVAFASAISTNILQIRHMGIFAFTDFHRVSTEHAEARRGDQDLFARSVENVDGAVEVVGLYAHAMAIICKRQPKVHQRPDQIMRRVDPDADVSRSLPDGPTGKYKPNISKLWNGYRGGRTISDSEAVQAHGVIVLC
ncbi:uncharacterized protein BCR38DRAFT_404040 [Pseudomassariella vexata]|uniref:Uncharacterized protein n=1 Tax=Pseudomassariella vexata TaxID=1141098 RepID=A0A1Y2EH47_9PEZI|nr:uncharacterized protein BCR38DRAFT_404040 [Pseudomassariella vexata]ORY70899.1 hypothetical protein BCR38DRAFT_404040 [Pseudomassariella vexata]